MQRHNPNPNNQPSQDVREQLQLARQLSQAKVTIAEQNDIIAHLDDQRHNQELSQHGLHQELVRMQQIINSQQQQLAQAAASNIQLATTNVELSQQVVIQGNTIRELTTQRDQALYELGIREDQVLDLLDENEHLMPGIPGASMPSAMATQAAVEQLMPLNNDLHFGSELDDGPSL